MIVLPEMFTTGFAMEAAKQSLPEADVVEWMHARAAQSQALIAGSAALQTEHGAVNRFLLVEPDGTVHHYDNGTCSVWPMNIITMRPETSAWSLNGVDGGILPLVCYDLRFPVWSRNQNDYDLALYVANWPAPRSAALAVRC
ncbi:hydrolase [Klebsiella pneumoniae]|uniref:Hydrolase n=1 Tax=Klebsiella pneumoniae TaxID=573 RepID=A0A2X3FDK5_KLEPN|nr:hydrolase [Klebsiella pneumoniae]